MSWVSLAHMTPGRPLATTHLRARHVDERRDQSAHNVHAGVAAGLGAARAGNEWQWAGPTRSVTALRAVPPALTPREFPLSIPAALVSAMRTAAHASGRSESEVWAEAAREWLRQRQHDEGPLPPAPAAALAVPRRVRSWSAIDALLADLRSAPAA